MIDGMDGLAGGSTLLSAVSLGIIALLWGNPLIASIMFILAGTLFGFMVFNYNPAKIFMGDTGSMFLGFTLSVFGWMLVDSGPLSSTAIIVPILVLGLPIADTLLAFFRRIIRGKNPFSADVFHIHHMLKLRFNLNVRQTVWMLYLITTVYCAAGVAVAMLPETTGWLVFAGIFIAKIIFLHFLGYTKLILPIQKPALAKQEPLVSLVHANGNGHSNGNGNGAVHAVSNGNGKHHGSTAPTPGVPKT
jgi:UDP-GlcNAc:undecaprenyl-phosphate/decaprenyl-phosphate GlcNAc-1-phosphate transferase